MSWIKWEIFSDVDVKTLTKELKVWKSIQQLQFLVQLLLMLQVEILDNLWSQLSLCSFLSCDTQCGRGYRKHTVGWKTVVIDNSPSTNWFCYESALISLHFTPCSVTKCKLTEPQGREMKYLIQVTEIKNQTSVQVFGSQNQLVDLFWDPGSLPWALCGWFLPSRPVIVFFLNKDFAAELWVVTYCWGWASASAPPFIFSSWLFLGIKP